MSRKVVLWYPRMNLNSGNFILNSLAQLREKSEVVPYLAVTHESQYRQTMDRDLNERGIKE